MNEHDGRDQEPSPPELPLEAAPDSVAPAIRSKGQGEEPAGLTPMRARRSERTDQVLPHGTASELVPSRASVVVEALKRVRQTGPGRGGAKSDGEYLVSNDRGLILDPGPGRTMSPGRDQAIPLLSKDTVQDLAGEELIDPSSVCRPSGVVAGRMASPDDRRAIGLRNPGTTNRDPRNSAPSFEGVPLVAVGQTPTSRGAVNERGDVATSSPSTPSGRLSPPALEGLPGVPAADRREITIHHEAAEQPDREHRNDQSIHVPTATLRDSTSPATWRSPGLATTRNLPCSPDPAASRVQIGQNQPQTPLNPAVDNVARVPVEFGIMSVSIGRSDESERRSPGESTGKDQPSPRGEQPQGLFGAPQVIGSPYHLTDGPLTSLIPDSNSYSPRGFASPSPSTTAWDAPLSLPCPRRRPGGRVRATKRAGDLPRRRLYRRPTNSSGNSLNSPGANGQGSCRPTIKINTINNKS